MYIFILCILLCMHITEIIKYLGYVKYSLCKLILLIPLVLALIIGFIVNYY